MHSGETSYRNIKVNEILLMVLKAFQDVVCEVYKTNTWNLSDIICLKEPNLSEDWDLFTGGVAQLWCFLSGCSVLLLHLLHLISKHHRDDDVPVIYAGKSSWLRLLLVCHHAVWQLSIHLLLQPDACHGRAPLNCERGVNIIISFASGLPDNIFRRTDTPRDALHSQAGGPHLELAIDF